MSLKKRKNKPYCKLLDKEIKKEKLLNDLEKIKKILLRLDKIMEQIETEYL